MGKGFDLFMQNPYWKKLYEEAPSDELREYLRRSYEYSATRREHKYNYPLHLSKQDYQYLYVHAEGGCYRVFLKKKISAFDEEENSM